MKSYSVTWLKGAEDQLAQIWLEASDRDAVTEASHRIDVALAEDADSKGTPLREGLRSLNDPPLRALFWVSEAERRVEVVSVRLLADLRPDPQSNGEPPPAGQDG